MVTTSVDWSEGPTKTFAPLSSGANPGAAALISPDRHFVIERFTLAPRVLVFGAGHVGAAIARAAATAGFRVTVVDDRSEFADPARFPSEVRVRVEDARVALAGFGAGPADAVVVATRGHRHDATILDQVARLPVGYIGLLGSRRKRAVIIRGLAAAGGPVEALARVRVPRGGRHRRHHTGGDRRERDRRADRVAAERRGYFTRLSSFSRESADRGPAMRTRSDPTVRTDGSAMVVPCAYPDICPPASAIRVW